MFHALAHCLKRLGQNWEHALLREELCDFLVQCKDLKPRAGHDRIPGATDSTIGELCVIAMVENGTRNFDKFIERQRKNGTWGCQTMLQVFATSFEYNVRLWRPTWNGEDLMCETISGFFTERNKESVDIFYNGHNHYHALMKLPGTDVVVVD
jgi:hypothetical protein